MGKPIYLGKVKLRWCDQHNLPLIGKKCDICGEEGKKVNITPPGEVRIGFEGDLNILRNAIKEQFGCEFSRKSVLFNRVPHFDRMDEVIIDGKVVGNLRFDINSHQFILTLRMEGAYMLSSCVKKGWIKADKGAIKPLLDGKNLMLPGVVDFSEGIKRGDEVIVKDESGKVFAVGIAKKSSEEMKKDEKGVAVKIRYSGYGEWKDRRDASVEEVIRANLSYLEKLEKKAVERIKEVYSQYNLPMAVSFSGGKDSLVTLLLALKSGIPFRTFFLNTGMELPETVDYVDEVEKKYGIKVDRIEAGDAFWRNLEHFGPPGRDYRWCCKVAKLGPTTRYILENYTSGVLTLIGQRRYESAERMRKGDIWRNEWVPNQLSFSPIQNWNSLEVWLYILWKRAPINPWYRRGLTRIGCYLCPAMDIGDFEIEKRYYDGVEKWFSYLRNFAKEHNIPEEWVKSSWRWKNPPEWAGKISFEREKLKITAEKREDHYILKFNKPVEWSRIKNMLTALPQGTYSISDNVIVQKDFLGEARSLIIRSQECVGCGVCLGRCPVNALYLDNEGKIKITEEKCIHCLDCLGKCPAEEF